MSKMIEISGLNKDYSGKKVIDGLDLEIDHGELFDFWGQMEQARPPPFAS